MTSFNTKTVRCYAVHVKFDVQAIQFNTSNLRKLSSHHLSHTHTHTHTHGTTRHKARF